MYEAVVFDNDGVLTERTDRSVLREAAREAFESFGVDPSASTLEDMVAGVDPGWLESICAAHGLDPDEFWRERDRQFAAFQCSETDAGRKPTYPDATVLDDLDQPLGVVSSNQNATIEHLFEFHDLHRHFETWYGREPTIESVHRKKPNPYYVERALDDLGASDALYVGDRATDVMAAHAAEIDSALVRRPHNREIDPEPTYDLDSLHELRAILEW